MGLTIIILNTMHLIISAGPLVKATGTVALPPRSTSAPAKWRGRLVWSQLPAGADLALAEGAPITFGVHTFQVLFTPGHTPGHVSFYEAEAGIVFDGDVLFADGIGRTDLPGGDYETLLASINEKLMVLPDETMVCSGHGPVTTIGRERASNPWL
jgi:glyoxylase-like metal-dependent hydrolase (beta-lactamase superfamily II)